jgi:hypothetical protein
MEAAELLTPMKTCPDVVDCIAQDQDSLILALDSLRAIEKRIHSAAPCHEKTF